MKAIVIAALMMGTVDAEQLRITAYDKARLPREVSETVVDTLRRIFRQSGIEIEWVAGIPGAPESSLMIYEPLRIGHERELACRARRDIALDFLHAAPPRLQEQVLGMAQPLARSGLNVRIFDDRIRKAGERENTAYALVLAHAIAHEIGHVLLRSSTHVGRGLMSEVWTGYEYDRMGKGALFFTADESRKMRMALSGAACPSVELTPSAARSETREPELK